jgi:hypothetical protein
MSTQIQPYKNSKKSTSPYLFLEYRYKKAGKVFNNPSTSSNARYTNVPLIYDRTFGVIGYPILKQK